MDIFKRQEVTNRTWQWIILWGLQEGKWQGEWLTLHCIWLHWWWYPSLRLMTSHPTRRQDQCLFKGRRGRQLKVKVIREKGSGSLALEEVCGPFPLNWREDWGQASCTPVSSNFWSLPRRKVTSLTFRNWGIQLLGVTGSWIIQTRYATIPGNLTVLDPGYPLEQSLATCGCWGSEMWPVPMRGIF